MKAHFGINFQFSSIEKLMATFDKYMQILEIMR